jgi:hypothetical protein
MFRIPPIVLSFFVLASASSTVHCQVLQPRVVVEEWPCPVEGTLRVFVSSVGRLELNGSPSSLAELSSAIARNDSSLQRFCYSNEGDPAAENPHQVALEALEVIARTGLPIDFYEDGKFKRRTRVVN